jgi:hypothetical protein
VRGRDVARWDQDPARGGVDVVHREKDVACEVENVGSWEQDVARALEDLVPREEDVASEWEADAVTERTVSLMEWRRSSVDWRS